MNLDTFGASFISFCNAHNEKVVQKRGVKKNIWLRYMLQIYYQLPLLLLLKIMILLYVQCTSTFNKYASSVCLHASDVYVSSWDNIGSFSFLLYYMTHIMIIP